MRAFKDLREFLQLRDSEKQLLRISERVSLEPDLAAAGMCTAIDIAPKDSALGAREVQEIKDPLRDFEAAMATGAMPGDDHSLSSARQQVASNDRVEINGVPSLFANTLFLF